MGLFKPLYLDKSQDIYKRKKALEKEKNLKRLRKFALDRKEDSNLRSIAVTKVNDPDLCEAVLMELSSDVPFEEPWPSELIHYRSAALILADLGEQERLEKIFASCVSGSIKGIIIRHIKNVDLLLKVALDENDEYHDSYISSPNAPCNAVENINEDDKLALIALQATNTGPSCLAVRKIVSQDLLGEILEKSPRFPVRFEALKRISDAGRYAEMIKNEVIPGIIEKPLDSYGAIEFLAMTGDKTGRVLAWLVKESLTHGKQTEIPEADADILIAVIKSIIEELSSNPSRSDINILYNKSATCIRCLHKNGINKEQIEKEFPSSLTYHYDYSEYDTCYEADYFETEHYTRDETVTFW